MSPSFPTGIQKRHHPSPAPRTLQRYLQADRIEELGAETMAPCTNCQKSPNSVCILRKGNARCSNCTRKNMKCDGQFSEDEYQSLQAQKEAPRNEVRAKHVRLSELAHEILRAQKSLAGDELRIEGITRQQSDMVARYSWVLDALDAEDGYAPDEPEPSSSDAQPNGGFVAFDDAELEQLMLLGSGQDFGDGTWQQTPQVCVPRVPKCFLIRYSLTI